MSLSLQGIIFCADKYFKAQTVIFIIAQTETIISNQMSIVANSIWIK